MKFFIIFRHWAGKISASFRVFRRGRWSCILGVQNNILTKNSLISSFLFILGHWGIFLPILAKKVAEFSKLDSQFQWILSGARVFCKIYKLLFSWISSGNISAGCPKKVSGAFKLLSTSPWEQFEETFFEKFLHLLWTFFRSFPVIEQEKFGRPVKTAFFVSIRSFWKKAVLENNWNFSSFSDIELEVSGFFSSFSTEMLELHFTCPR